MCYQNGMHRIKFFIVKVMTNFPRFHQDCGGQAKPSEIYNLNYDMI